MPKVVYADGTVREMNADEIKVMQKESAKAERQEKSRPLTESEVSRMLITQQINTLTVDDNTALRMQTYYPEWAVGLTVKPGERYQYGDKLYKVKDGQGHVTQSDWTPNVAVSMFEVVNATHDGTMVDPIPYDGNMALEQGKHYLQNDEVYLCTRDTVNPVYNPLAELVGVYVEIV